MQFDEVWIIPAYTHTFEKNFSEFQHRMNMCMIVFKDYRFIVSDFQKSRDCGSSTLSLFEKLNKEYKDKDFYMVIGPDHPNNIHKWINYRQVINFIKFIVIERKNFELMLDNSWCLQAPRIYVNDLDLDQISSTLARNAIRNDKNARKFVHRYIIDYIENNNLYK